MECAMNVDASYRFPAGTGLLLVGHGSREQVGVDEFMAAAALVAGGAGDTPVEPCFLEFAQPSIAEGFHALAARGARQVIVVPVLLFAAGHAKRDIPAAVEAVACEHPGIAVRQSDPLNCHRDLLTLSRLRCEQSLAGRPAVDAAWTLVVLAGRGSYDEEATAEMRRFASLVGEQSGLRAEVGFVAMAEPRLESVLESAAASDVRRIIVVPHLLFGGVLVERIGEIVSGIATRHPDCEWLLAAHLGPHHLVARAVLARASETTAV
jgi:sirohydrochlorin cobaltochelatase